MTPDTGPAPERFALTTADGLRLRAEWAAGEADAASNTPPPTVVLCHPHPLHGGTMYAGIIDVLFRALPPLGVSCLRFNFRGVQGSDGRHDHGDRERLDVTAAIDEAVARRPDHPVRLVGWSFGGDLALATSHDALDGWVAIAPPLRVVEPDQMPAGSDPRPAHLLVGEHDAFRSPASAADAIAGWSNGTITPIQGADHFFAAHMREVVDHVAELLVAPQ